MIEFAQPYWLICIVPAVIILFLIIRRDFTKLQGDRRKINRARKFILVSRFLIFTLLIIAIANPNILIKAELQTPPKIELLIDNSSSMQVFDTSFVPELERSLSEKIPVETKIMCSSVASDIGDGIMSVLEEDKNILIISDGQVTDGTTLSDVALFAYSLNATVSAINLEPNQNDISLSIAGPTKTVIGAENTIIVEKKEIGTPSTESIEIKIDGIPQSSEIINYKFSTEGYHTIEAKISSEDFYKNNNEFYKTIKVVEKPKILYVTQKQDPIEDIFNQLYSVEKLSSLPSDISRYHAIVINDLSSEKISGVDALKDYVINGNGLVVIGGFNSFDRGNYKGSVFESLLPVQVGTGEKKKGGSNIVIIFDISSSTTTETELGSQIVEAERELATSVLNDLSPSNRVSVIAFNTNAYQLTKLEPILDNKETIARRIRSISTGGGTTISVGLSAAYEVLKNAAGDKNIILITDGLSNGELDIAKSLELGQIYGDQGIKIYTIGVGRYANAELLKQIANEGHGTYFKGDESHKIRILFGEVGKSSENTFSLFIVDSGHFITSGLDLNAKVDAYNQVAPKTSSRMLVTTDNGNPAVTAWRYGVGRVVVVTAFSTNNNLGEILNRQNSLLVTRIVNWAVGDPERKQEYSVNIEDARINKDVLVRVKSDSYPQAEGLNFIKSGENEYAARFQSKNIGFGTLLNAKYAVNYEKEYESLGVSPELDFTVQATGGKFFNSNEIDNIVEYVRTISTKTRITEISLQWIFIVIALIVFLVEVCIRRAKVGLWQNI